MRDKELRLALICYGGISLAVYMHGVTKEVWKLAQASRAHHDDDPKAPSSADVYRDLLSHIRVHWGVDLRVFPDIIAGASAGGINGIFLAQAVATGQSLDPLTQMWLDNADVDQLLDPDARPESNYTKFWATPIAWLALRKPGSVIDQTVSAEGRDEVREKLTKFVRARWFEPPFGGAGFTNMLLNAFEVMASLPAGPRLLPQGQPIDLFVSVTDFNGFPTKLRLNTPVEAVENEHRLTISFQQRNDKNSLGDSAELAFAARATASFPGAFPPFSVRELDGVLKQRGQKWEGRRDFLNRTLPGHSEPDDAVLIDGSVLANAPFEPAIKALSERPARREVDRRFVYIDPKPGLRSVRLTRSGNAELPGFFGTILGAMSDIPREQPIRDSLERIDGRSARIRRLQRVIDAISPSVDLSIEKLFGRTFFLDTPTAPRLSNWRRKAQEAAARDAGFAYASYGNIKLSAMVEDMARLVSRQSGTMNADAFEDLRQRIWAEVRSRGADQVWNSKGSGATEAAISFFRQHDLGFRIRRLRFVIRTIARLIDQGRVAEAEVRPLQMALFDLLSKHLDRENINFYKTIDQISAAALINDIAHQRDLIDVDQQTDERLAQAFAACPKGERRTIMFAYLGFAYFDISTLSMLQGEGLDEFDPIKVDRISPDDALAIRKGGVAATLKGIEFNSFGAFFSRAYRENDYLWGRLHGADRLFDIICSSIHGLDVGGDAELQRLKRELLLAILAEEEGRLTRIPALFGTIRAEIAAGPLGESSR